MKSKICSAQMHTDYGPSYPKAYDHPTLFLKELVPKHRKTSIFIWSTWIGWIENYIYGSENGSTI